MNVHLQGRERAVSPKQLIGKGGEAEIFSWGQYRALKLFKLPSHPDHTTPAERLAASERIREHQRKLPAFPTGLPDNVLGPLALATDGPNGTIVGYAMQRVRGARELYSLGEPRVRRSREVSGAAITRVLLAVHNTLARLHDRSVVIGDLNDLNVLVDKRNTVYFIDTDSYQFGEYPCRVYSERFVDPLVCDPAARAPSLRGQLSASTDWYAFAVIAMRSLLGVGPYGGVHRPARASQRIAHAARPLHRLSVYDTEVLYPKSALHFSILPDALNDHFESVFHRDKRLPFPRHLLDDLHWTVCTGCGLEHSRPRCPRCARSMAPQPARAARGTIHAQVIHPGPLSALERTRLLADRGVAVATPRARLEGDRLLREGPWGPESIGDVVGTSCRIWEEESLGAGYYSAGRFLVAFTFDPHRGGLQDGARLAPLRGKVIASHCALSSDRAWLFFFEELGGRVQGRCAVVDGSGRCLVDTALDDDHLDWSQAAAGATAIGSVLFVPTDDGLRRVEIDGGHLATTRHFPDAEPFLDATSRLWATRDGIYVGGPGLTLLTMKGADHA